MLEGGAKGGRSFQLLARPGNIFCGLEGPLVNGGRSFHLLSLTAAYVSIAEIAEVGRGIIFHVLSWFVALAFCDARRV